MGEKVIEIPADLPLLPVIELTAGNIKCLYEKGNLRYLKYDDVELLRMIYVAVRNENWSTATHEIHDEEIEQHENSFTVKYVANFSYDKEVYKTAVSIVGKENGEISFTMKGEALDNFSSNRIGICVLHPLKECCGKQVQITNPQDETEQSNFPDLISPHQPFINVSGMQWSPSDHITARLQFYGDIFETEDQRNWTDGSFKTYSTPLSIPFPVNVKTGDSKQQQVIFSIRAQEAPVPGDNVDEEKKIPFPGIGHCRLESSEKLDRKAIDNLKQIPFDHYYVTVNTHAKDWREQWKIATAEAVDLDTKIVCVVNFQDTDEILDVITGLAANADVIRSMLFIPGNKGVIDAEWMQQNTAEIKNRLPGVAVEYGSGRYFAELNRNRLNAIADVISFPVNPQAHAVDIRTLADNLESHHYLLKTVRYILPAEQIRVGPFSVDSSSKQLSDSNLLCWWILVAIGNFATAGAVTIGPVNGTLLGMLRELKVFNPLWVIQKNGSKDFSSELVVENADEDRLVFRLKS